jgi:LysR family transcriptional regulator, glycine cleavage system transcriptional activator
MYRRPVASARDPLPLPPLNALRAFEATARHGSFTRAARELCVTQTAVSHQIRLLEEQLGTPLFYREPRRISLTEDGRAWATALSDVFERLHEANRRLRARHARERPLVSVSVLPSFASRWLVPRLGRFLERRPDVDLRLSPTQELVDFTAGGVDVGIRYGAGKYPGLRVEKLCDDAWVVVCAPSLRGRAKLRSLSDLSRFALLCDDDGEHTFPALLSDHPNGRCDVASGVVFTDSSMVVEAAVRGQGVALARLSLAADDLAAGRLVRPFRDLEATPTGLSYFVVGPKEAFRRGEVAAFRDWLVEEAAGLAGPRAEVGARAGARPAKARAERRRRAP